MAAKLKDIKKKDAPAVDVENDVYRHETPKWRRYYHKVRKGIRFPRYYKKALNW